MRYPLPEGRKPLRKRRLFSMKRPIPYCFYKDPEYGLIKALGSRDGKFVFERWDRTAFGNDWCVKDLIHLDENLYLQWMVKGRVKRVPPPM